MIEAVVAGLGILIALNGAILAYVISIDRRLTRLKTFQEIRRAPRQAVPAEKERVHSVVRVSRCSSNRPSPENVTGIAYNPSLGTPVPMSPSLRFPIR